MSDTQEDPIITLYEVMSEFAAYANEIVSFMKPYIDNNGVVESEWWAEMDNKMEFIGVVLPQLFSRLVGDQGAEILLQTFEDVVKNGDES